MKKSFEKNIAVIALGFLGDTILVEPMCRNLKKAFPDSNIIFIANELFVDIPKGFTSVDKIYGFDKKTKHKGILGYLKFKQDFKEKNIDYAIVTHVHERSLILAKLLGAKKIISLSRKKNPVNLLITDKRDFIEEEIRNTFKADYNNGYLKNICKYENLPAQYCRKDIDFSAIATKFSLPEKYVVLSPTSKDLIKDWDYQNIKSFVVNSDTPVALVGTQKANEIAKQLAKENINFIDLTLKTTIEELGAIIKEAEFCVSVDTGTFHLSYAQGVRTIGLFFNEDMIKEWAPQNLDNVKILVGERQKIKDEILYIKDIFYHDVKKAMEEMIYGA